MSALKNSQSGFSMIEMLVAIVILAIGLLGLAQLQVTAIRTNSQSMTSTSATVLAQRIIEEVVALGPDHSLFNTVTTTPQTWAGSPFTMASGGTYNVTYEVAEVDPDNNTSTANNISNLVLVTIKVTSTTELRTVTGADTREVIATTLKRVI